MNSLKINFFDNVDEVIRKAKRKFGEDKEFGFAVWPADGSLRLIMDGTVNPEEEKGGKIE